MDRKWSISANDFFAKPLPPAASGGYSNPSPAVPVMGTTHKRGNRWSLITSGSLTTMHGYRHPATPAAAEIPLTAIAEKEKQRRISRAAQVLEPYFVNASDLNVLCGSESHFAEGEQALTDRIAKAWAELDPYGVSPDDLKKLISVDLKNAWRRSRSQQPLNPQHLDGHRKFGMQNNPNPSQREVRALLPTDGFLHSPIRERSE